MQFLTEENKKQLEGIARFLRLPGRMRGLCVLTLLVVGYFGVYEPQNTRWMRAKHHRGQISAKLDIVQDVQSLRNQVRRLEERLPQESCPLTWWTDRFIEITRETAVSLDSLTPKPLAERIGAYQKIQFDLSVAGNYFDILRFLARLEGSSVPMRVLRLNVNIRGGIHVADILVVSFRICPEERARA